MALSPADQALLDRLNSYNGNAYNATTNPLGFARGGNQQGVFIAAVKDIASVGALAANAAVTATDKAALTASDRTVTGQDREAAAQSASNAATSATNAANALDAFDDRMLGPKATDPTTDNDGSAFLVGAMYFNTTLNVMKVWNGAAWQVFIPSAADYYTKTQVDAIFANLPPILPITLTAPAANATGIGQGGTYTFVARAFVGDTTGFYSNYGIPVASRFVNVYEPGGAVPVKVFSAAGGGPSLAVNFTGSGLVVSHVYQFEFGYTDAQGNTVKSPKVSATTGAQFKPTPGQSYEGGFLAFENFGDGPLVDLVVAPKSTEASRAWDPNGSTLRGMFSRVSGDRNTTIIVNAGMNTTYAASYAANSVTIGGVAAYLAAIDELRAIASKLKPSAAVEAAFKAGGSEVFPSSFSWTSTEETGSAARVVNMTVGDDPGTSNKTTGLFVRAIKRVAVTPPFAIGTQMEGGYLAAFFTDLSSGSPVTYMLIVADKATEVTRAWATINGGGTASRTNGFLYKGITNSDYPAFVYANSLSSGGKTDWYLGAIDEMLAIARMNSQLPSGQVLINNAGYWSSTEIDASNAKAFDPAASGTPSEYSYGKSSTRLVRPIRRVLLPAA